MQFTTYQEIMDYAKSQDRVRDGSTYYERHHVVPRFMGGTDEDDNLVYLTLYEHVLAHYFLALEYETTDHGLYVGNLFGAYMIFSGKKSSDVSIVKDAIRNFLNDEDAIALIEKIKRARKGVINRNTWRTEPAEYWVQFYNQYPTRFSKTMAEKYALEDYVVLIGKECPICKAPNSRSSFACRKEHEDEYLDKMKLERASYQSAVVAKSWEFEGRRERTAASISTAHRLRNEKIANGEIPGKVWVTNGIDSKQVDEDKVPGGWRLGRTMEKRGPLSEETRARMRGKNGVGVYVNKDDVVRRVSPEELDLFLTDGWVKGNPKAASMKGKHGYKQLNRTKRVAAHLNGQEKYFESVEKAIEAGWILGREPSSMNGVNNSKKNTGRIHVTKDGRSKMVFPEDLDEAVKDGWVHGRTIKTKEPESYTKDGYVLVTKNGRNKKVKVENLDTMLEEGWVVGRTKNKDKKPSDIKDLYYVTKDGINLKVTEQELEGYLSNGWRRGATIRSCPKELRKRRNLIWMNKDGKNAMVEETNLDRLSGEGWVRGKLDYKPHKKSTVPSKRKGLVWVTKDGTNKPIDPSELLKFQENGWVRGKYHRKYKDKWSR